MSMQSVNISGFKAGVQKSKKPFLLNEDTFSNLKNAYVFREELRTREGLKLVGRFRRVLTAETLKQSDGLAMSFTAAGTGSQTIDIFTLYSLSGTEPNPQIQPGSVPLPNIITLDSGGANETILTDSAGTGLLVVTGAAPVITSAWIDYTTGIITAVFTSAPAGMSVALTIRYFPSLPGMGIIVREVEGINDEQTVWFDTKYAYIHDGADFQELSSLTTVTWGGTDSDFFWGTNYRGSSESLRLFFVTNFLNQTNSPMRYYDGASVDWTDFSPIISGTKTTDVLSTTLAFGSAAFGPSSLSTVPLIEGTVVITVSDNSNTDNDVVFRDTPKDGTLISLGVAAGTIDYVTGAITLAFVPPLPGAATWTVTAVYDVQENILLTARILIPYYGRLVALNTYEGTALGGGSNIYNRARFSQIGDPTQEDAWRSDVFGKGGYIDAPTNEEIVSAAFYKKVLIVHFERSTWRLQYVGEYGFPFLWERISSDYGSESTLSSVIFDNGVLTVGDKAIVASDGNTVDRIDSDIPDTVYDFKNTDNGPKRVCGVRDFKKELVYWAYPDYKIQEQTQYFPSTSLVYNYRNNTFAFFRNNVTCFGSFQYPSGITWDRTDVFWDDDNITWDNTGQEKFPSIACANQQGFAHFYGYTDVETVADSTINLNDQESLSIYAVTVSDDVRLTIPNHNLMTGEYIYIAGLIYADTVNSVAGSTTLNDFIYYVSFIDVDTILLLKYNQDVDDIAKDFDVTNVGTYVGGGVVALLPKLWIETKDFNPMKQAGQNIKTSYIDFLFDTTTNSVVSVVMLMNATTPSFGSVFGGDKLQGNFLVGNQKVELSNRKFGNITDVSTVNPTANPCVITSKDHGLLDGDTISIENVLGTTEVNGIYFTVTFISTDTFSIGVDGSGYTTYESGGQWYQTNEQYYTFNSQYTWHRFFSSTYGQYFKLFLTYNEEQMSIASTHQQNFVLNAMQIYFLPGGKNIFGK